MPTTITPRQDDPNPYRDSWGNRYSTPDAGHLAPGPLVEAPRTVLYAPRAVMAYLGGHHVLMPHDGNLTRTIRIGLTVLAFRLGDRPVPPAVTALPGDEQAKLYDDYFTRCAGRYNGVEVTTTHESDGDRVGYSTSTSGGGGYIADTFHVVTLDDVKAAASSLYA